MLLRSSSTPVIGTLTLSTLSDTPTRDFLDAINKPKNTTRNAPFHDRLPPPPPSAAPPSTKLISSFHGGVPRHRNLKSLSCNSSPIKGSISSGFNRQPRISSQKSIRRAQSEGNLEGLLISAVESCELTKSAYRHIRSMVRADQSFSMLNSDAIRDDNGDSRMDSGTGEVLQRTVTIGETIDAVSGDQLGKMDMGLIEEGDGEEEKEILDAIQNFGIGGEEEIERIGTPPLCIASGLGIGASCFVNGEGFDLNLGHLDETSDMEEYYKRMVEQCPFHPLFLRNYAQLLQSKGDLHGAEEHYSRAALSDPEDGEIWMQYAKLVWDLHHDQERASSYFKRATEVAPRDCNILAAYASFLWEIEASREEKEARESHIQFKQSECVNELENLSFKREKGSPCLNIAGGIRIDVPNFTTDGTSRSGNPEDYYRKMIEENPNEPLFLKNYAKFLYESKGDLQRAEEYYSRSILVDPGDGEVLSQYAKLVWELHHDGHKASSYFERAVRASPENSHVLAAYTSFLWENEDDEENRIRPEDQIQVPLFHEGTMAAANV